MALIDLKYLRSSLGKKTLMGLTGLGLCGFVLIHMLGNLLLFFGADSFNRYSYALTNNPLIEIAEIGLLLFFVGHILAAVWVTLQNKLARTGHYAVRPPSQRDATLASKTLIYSGWVILAFVVLHLKTFKYGPHYGIVRGGVEMRDLYQLVVEIFSQPLYVVWYVFSMIILAMHLSHSISASMQTLGWFSSTDSRLRWASISFGWIVSAGFILETVSVSLLGVR